MRWIGSSFVLCLAFCSFAHRAYSADCYLDYRDEFGGIELRYSAIETRIGTDVFICEKLWSDRDYVCYSTCHGMSSSDVLFIYGSDFDDDIRPCKHLEQCSEYEPTENSWNRVVINGYEGDDFIFGHVGTDFIFGDEGCDSLKGDAGNDFLALGNPYLASECANGAEAAHGDEGDDLIFGSSSGDVIIGGEDDDRIYGYDGSDKLYGGPGADILYGGDGNDFLMGFWASSTGEGDPDDDELYGEGDFDLLCDENMHDIDHFDGGPGTDFHYRERMDIDTVLSSNHHAWGCDGWW